MRRPSKRIFFFASLLIVLVGVLHGGRRGVTPRALPMPRDGALQAQKSAPPASQAPQRKDDDYRILRDVNLVVLHATVVDDRGKFVSDLKQESFRVFEDKVEQKLSVFKREDIPISVGLVVDNSGSMRD